MGSGNTPAGTDQIADIVNLDRGAEIVYLLTGTIDPAVRESFEVAISTEVPDRFVETNPSNNRATDRDDVLPVVDVSVQTDDGRPDDDPGVIPGVDDVTYTVTATNAGPGLATDVEFANQFDLPSGTRVVSTVATKGTYDPDTNQWTVGELAVGEVATLQILVRVDALASPGAVIRHTVFLDSVAEVDSDLSNNLSAATTPIAGASNRPRRHNPVPIRWPPSPVTIRPRPVTIPASVGVCPRRGVPAALPVSPPTHRYLSTRRCPETSTATASADVAEWTCQGRWMVRTAEPCNIAAVGQLVPLCGLAQSAVWRRRW